MASVTGNFKELNSRLLKELKFFEHGPAERIQFSTNEQFVNELKTRIAAAAGRFPPIYQEGYIDPLLKNLKPIIATLMRVDPGTGKDDAQAYAVLTLLVNAALQPTQDGMAKYIRSSQPIVDDLYNSFLAKRRQLGVQGPLDQEVPPLVGFIGPLPPIVGSDQAPMPCMLELEQLQEPELLGPLAKDFKAGVVGLPAGYMEAPLLWGTVGHEVGGHYVLTADQGDKVLNELQEKIYDKLLEEKYSREVAALWVYWAEEAAADVCGVLNLGPSFGIGAISFYTAQFYLGHWAEKERLDGVFQLGNQHPTPALAPHVIRGAVEGLKKLGLSRKMRYIAQLEEIATFYTVDCNAMTFPDGSVVPDPKKKGENVTLPATLPLQEMQESARLVGHYIATVSLSELRGHPIGEDHDLQDLATWGDADEDAALAVADQLKTGSSATTIAMNVNKVKGLQLLSGGILAVIRQPSLYKHINEALSNTLGRR